MQSPDEEHGERAEPTPETEPDMAVDGDTFFDGDEVPEAGDEVPEAGTVSEADTVSIESDRFLTDVVASHESDRSDLGEPSDDVLADAVRAIEAIVMVATDPVPDHLLAQLIELPQAAVRVLCQNLSAQYAEQQRGFEFVEIAGGWRYQSHASQAPYVERFALEGQTARLSGAALETLAIVAYKQPISRGQVSAIRGVNADGVLRTLEQRGYIAEIGRDSGPGQAILLGTTNEFLERLGLGSPDDLPLLGEFVPSAAIVEMLENTLRAEPIDDEITATPSEPERSLNEQLEESALSGVPVAEVDEAEVGSTYDAAANSAPFTTPDQDEIDAEDDENGANPS